jgi:hypothetical protein
MRKHSKTLSLKKNCIKVRELFENTNFISYLTYYSDTVQKLTSPTHCSPFISGGLSFLLLF